MRRRVVQRGAALRDVIAVCDSQVAMPSPSRHIGKSIDRSASDVYDYVCEPANLPEWAPGLARSVQQIDGRWIADSPMGRVVVAFVGCNDHGVLDHEVTLPSGETIYNPMRVIADGSGCEIVFTLRRQASMSDEELARDAEAVYADLGALKRVLEQQSR